MINKLSYQPHVDGLRAFAVISVILFHLDITLFSGGFVGVDIFFVISGYLITRIIVKEIDATNSFSFKNFYLRRVRRLFPAFIVVSLTSLLLATVILSPSLMKSFAGSLLSAIFSISNFFFWFEADYFDVSSHYKPLLHTWSLSIEEQFYMFWPITLLILLKLRSKILLYISLLLLFTGSLLLNFMFSDGSVNFINVYFPNYKDFFVDGKSTIFYLLPFRVFEFLCGASLVWLTLKIPNKSVLADMLTVSGLVMVLYSVFWFDASIIFPSYNALFPSVGTALIILAAGKSRLSFILENKLVVWIGLVSYSLYLVHWPVIVFWKYMKIGDPLGSLDKFAISGISILLGYLSYKYVETPFRKPSIATTFNLKRALGASSLIIAVVAGAHASMTDGWQWRLNNDNKFDVSLSDSKFHREYYGGEGYPRYGGHKTDSAPSIILAGDSHGRHYAEGVFTSIAEPTSQPFYIAAGTSCLHLPYYTRIKEGVNFDLSCPSGLATLIEYAKRAEKKATIIISHWWLTQLEQAAFINAEGQVLETSPDQHDIIDSIRTLKNLLGSANIVVIGLVPTPSGRDLFDLYTRPNFELFYSTSYESLEFSDAKLEFVQFNSFLEDELAEIEGVYFFDPFKALCQQNKCKNFNEDNELLYSDEHHLSKFGSVYVVNKFKKELIEIVTAD